MKYHALSQPIMIGSMEVKNRFAVPAMDTKYCGLDGFVTQQLIDYWVERAKGGFGLLITECTPADRMGVAGGCMQIWDDKFIPGLKRLTDAVHEYGAKIVPQLYHCGRQTSPLLLDGKQPVAPTAIPCSLNKTMPRELTTEEVYEVIENISDGAVRAKTAGFDGVELHGGHGYIISEFMSAYYNKRVDEFGGTFESRMKFPVDLVRRIKEKCGEDYPVIFRLSSEEMCPGGREIAETKAACRMLEDAGVDAIDLTVANYYSFHYNVAAHSVAPGFNLTNAEEVKKSVSIPVIGIGRINTPAIGEDAILSGKADIIGFGRGSIADPYLPNKTMAGDAAHIAPCTGCLEGCVGHIFTPDPNVKVTCIINPFCGREGELVLRPAEIKKKVVIVGGGPAGLEAAWIAAKRGHDVTLFEKTDHLGGQYRIAAIPPMKQGVAGQVAYLIYMAKKYGVDIRMNCEVTEEMIKEINADVVILATGANPSIPPIKGIDGANVVQANDVLDAKAFPTKPFSNVLIIGGGLVGAETADFLGEHEHQVTIIDMLPEIGMNFVPSIKTFLKQRYKQYGVTEITNSMVKEINGDVVTYEQNGEVVELKGIDTVVVASGSKPYNPLEEKLQGKVKELYVIGDAKEVRLALNAIEEGARIALAI